MSDVKEDNASVSNQSCLLDQSTWRVLPNSVEGLFDIVEHDAEYPEEGVMRWAVVPDSYSAEYLHTRLQALETIRGWIFDPNCQEDDTQDPADLVRKIGNLLGWYDSRPQVER